MHIYIYYVFGSMAANNWPFDLCLSFHVVSRSQTLYLPLPATWGGKGLAHTNRASGSGLHRKTVEEIRPHSMNLIKKGTCQNDFCARESYITNVGLASSQGAALSMSYQQLTSSIDD